MPFSTMTETYVLFAPSQLRYFSLSFTSWLPEDCHSGAPRAECLHHHTPLHFVHRERLAPVRGQDCIPSRLSPYPENSELKTKILADISLYLEILLPQPVAERGASKPTSPTLPSEVGWRGQWVRSVGQQHILAD